MTKSDICSLCGKEKKEHRRVFDKSWFLMCPNDSGDTFISLAQAHSVATSALVTAPASGELRGKPFHEVAEQVRNNAGNAAISDGSPSDGGSFIETCICGAKGFILEEDGMFLVVCSRHCVMREIPDLPPDNSVNKAIEKWNTEVRKLKHPSPVAVMCKCGHLKSEHAPDGECAVMCKDGIMCGCPCFIHVIEGGSLPNITEASRRTKSESTTDIELKGNVAGSNPADGNFFDCPFCNNKLQLKNDYHLGKQYGWYVYCADCRIELSDISGRRRIYDIVRKYVRSHDE